MDNERGQCWRDVEDVLDAGIDRLLLYGPPGTGKTYAALAVGRGEPAERIVCTEDLTGAEVTGTWMPGEGGRFAWREGPAIRAWRAGGGRGGRLVLDEVDRAAGDALATLLAVTDSTASARWRHPESLEWVRPGPDYSVVATSNVEDVEDLPPPLLDRFAVRVRIDRPHPAAVAALAPDLRAPALAGSLGPSSRRVSLRRFYAFDRLRARLGAERAAAVVFGPAAADVLDALAIASIA
ncbi:MAG TPA: MoxR family ATPase [Acidimicrobiales bacterium]|nr:MoxR family ATPase [Acidimicrobiales bacterium]